jgi:hypothetical protein
MGVGCGFEGGIGEDIRQEYNIQSYRHTSLSIEWVGMAEGQSSGYQHSHPSAEI